MNSNRKGFSLPVSEPMLLDDDDLRIIRSALIKSRKTSGSVRADRLIQMITYQLEHPDTHRLNIPFA